MSDTISVRVTTRSSRPGIGEWKADPSGRLFLEVRVAAPPVDGAANAELVRMIAGKLGVGRSEVAVVSGETARLKRIAIPCSQEDAMDRLGDA